jgi:dipeptidyl-peptidase-4
MDDSYPRQHARTRGFNLGLPRAFTVAADGSRVAFLRTPAGDDPSASLWVYDVDGEERVVFGPADAGEEGITPEERDRRERAGEKQTGVVTYAVDPLLRVASFVVGRRLMLADLIDGGARELAPAVPAFDPRSDPTASRVAYVGSGALRCVDLATGDDVELAADPDPDVHWGAAEFVAAEEIGRSRGYWWAPDGMRLIACRVDERSVAVWHIASPIDPTAPPRAVRYPQTGTPNADVTLHVVGLDGSSVEVRWDREAFEYVAAVDWTDEGPPLALVQSRDQRDVQVLGIDPDSGATEVLWHDHDDVWIDLIPGVPTWLPGGRLLTAGHRDDATRLLVDGIPVTPSSLRVWSVVEAGDAVTFTATDDPTVMHVWRLSADGTLAALSDAPGLHAAAAGGDLTVLASDTAAQPLPSAVAMRAGEPVHTFDRHAEQPVLHPKPEFALLGSRELRAALFTPGGAEPDAPLPVLMDPYGGPHFGRVTRTTRGQLESQWFADQGFVVIVADGRGTPNRGVAWDQAVHGDLATPALEDQVDALHAAAELHPFLDLTKVAIRGWSFGGFLTALALLRRPDVFHAGISGAPVTDMRYYDTHYTERYLGTPRANPAAYELSDVVKDAANLRGELLLIHGIADDNVYVTHSLQLSKALMEHGRRHAMIPLSGITHRPTDEAAAANMLKIQVEFLRRALGIPTPEDRTPAIPG